MKKVISSNGAPKAVGPYSQAIEAGGTLYISGQLPVNPADGTVPPTVEEQTARSLDNIKAILSEAGYSLEDAVKMTVLLDDIANFGAMNGVYAKYFTSDMPARVCYQVAALPMGVKVEIDAIAVRK
jgi:2-iminobutanoate/2-iminopropanoate deaminase